MLIKLDMSKVYNRVDCDYLKLTLSILGFPTRLINLILMCVKLASFYILVNGILNGPIFPNRGLRQTDPLSSYHFTLCTE